MRVFLDTNVILDYLLKREPHYAASKKVFDMCLYKIDGFITPHSLIDVFYTLSERTTSSVEYCRNTIQKLRSVLNVVAEDDNTVYSAADNADFSDFEDSMQNESARFAKADYIITRNTKDFAGADIPVLSPTEFLQHIEDGNER